MPAFDISSRGRFRDKCITLKVAFWGGERWEWGQNVSEKMQSSSSYFLSVAEVKSVLCLPGGCGYFLHVMFTPFSIPEPVAGTKGMHSVVCNL